jgi:hypothetical protein
LKGKAKSEKAQGEVFKAFRRAPLQSQNMRTGYQEAEAHYIALTPYQRTVNSSQGILPKTLHYLSLLDWIS